MKSKFLILIIALMHFSFAQKKIEDFGSFSRKFFGDSTFQISRIVFPIKLHCEAPTYDTIDSTIDKSHWSYSDYGFYKNLYYFRTYDNFKRDYRNTGERVIAFEGMDNGININFFFKLVRNKWFLTKIIDNSD